MRRNRLSEIRASTFLAILLCFMGSGCWQRYAQHYKQLDYPKLGDIKTAEVERVTLANGMRLFLLEDHELPVVNVWAMIRTGSVYEPADKIGLASITGTVMRTGGTTSKTGDEIDEELERIAAWVESDIGLNSGSASVSVLKEDLGTGLVILADVLMNPAFREDKIELAKIEHCSAIARRNDSVRPIAYREFKKLIYGAGSVYARHSEYATIGNIGRADLVAFHKKFYHPNNIMLGVWGDFDTEEMINRIEGVFQGWERVDMQPAATPEVRYEFRPTVNLIRKEDINQTMIWLGHIGGLMSDPDYSALTVMNTILGRGFTGRLFKNVRSRLGLAYSVGGRYSAEYDHPGVFYVGCQTKSEATVRSTRAMMREVERITESEVTDEELALAKESYLNSFVFRFDSKGEIVERLMTHEYFGYPPDFLERTRDKVEKVTKEDVLRVARKHLRPDKLQILCAGRPEDFDEPLSVLGPVREIDITIPAPER